MAEQDVANVQTPGSIPAIRSIIQERRPSYAAKHDGKPCPWCGSTMIAGDPYQGPSREHVVPKSRLPKGVRGPIVIVCLTCNNRKKDYTLSEWVSRLPKRTQPNEPDRRWMILKWANENQNLYAQIKALEARVLKSKHPGRANSLAPQSQKVEMVKTPQYGVRSAPVKWMRGWETD